MKDLQTSAHAPSLTLELLMDYLEGKLSEQEAARVDAVLEDEPEWIDVLETLESGLKQEPDFRDKAAAMKQAASEAAFRASAPSPEETVAPAAEAKTIRIPLWKQPMWRMAAVIALIALPMGWLALQPQGNLYDQMSEQYLQPFAVTVTKGGPTAADILDQGLATYQSGNYALAAQNLAAIVDSEDLTSDERLTATMYLGLSYLFSGEASKATDRLSEVVDAGNTVFLSHAQWYLAWAQWKAGQTELARAGFEQIAAAPGTNQKPAQKILDAWK